ncbi:helix-turn-helix domain-containing protein [Poseidonocella sp. HB161398]|uniref:helix-turn-helix domain-containing protein n=1 Tax=Poseidonocella sp. HB161398 TaxID=2320855 RepID=UPI0014868A55|nr:AraC family transcriptional regulator [Poseidonocella sp. HB161398]
MTAVCAADEGTLALHAIRAARLRSADDLRDPCEGLSGQDGFLVDIHMRAQRMHRLWRGDRLWAEGPLAEGAVSIRDLRPGWREACSAPPDAVRFRIPFDALRAFAVSAGRPEFARLGSAHGIGDPSLHGLARALGPALEDPGSASRLFLDQMGLAVLAHLVQRHGGLRLRVPRKGGLAPWQEARATEVLAAHLSGQVALADLAAACGLSQSHFGRAFKTSFGKTPLRWLTEYRIARARDLLRSGMPVAEIAPRCGFADQSHLTRVFSAIMGEAPASWRRAQGSPRRAGAGDARASCAGPGASVRARSPSSG